MRSARRKSQVLPLLLALILLNMVVGQCSSPPPLQAASPGVTTPLQASGLRPIWEENFPGGSLEKGVFTWAKGHNDALTSSTIPGALHIGHQRGQQWGRHWAEHQINFFKTADNEPPPTILEFDVFTPLTGDNRLSLRKSRFGGEFVHIRLSNRKDVSLVVLKSQMGSNVPRQYIYYDEKTGPGYGWAHITLSYKQSIRNGQRYVHYVLAINEEVREFEGPSDWPGDSWLDYWARNDNAVAWSIEYNSTEDKMDKYLANFRAYEGTLSRAEMEQRLRGRVDNYRAQLPDPTTYNGLERPFQLHKPLQELAVNALAYGEQIAPLTFEFDGSLSSSWKRIDSYHWAFGDGTTAAGRLATHTYDQPGTYEVVLTTSSRYYGSDSHTLTVKAASPTVTTPLQASGLGAIWEENFPGGSPEKGVFTWAKGHNDALTSSTIPGALHIGHQRGQQWNWPWAEQQINFFKTADNEPPPTILEFDLFTPLTGNNRISLRKTRFGGEFVHIRLSNKEGVSLVILKSQKGSNVPEQHIYYDEKTGPGYGWAHITLSYDQYIRNGQRYVHYVLAINEEVREFEGLSDWAGDSWLDYWARNNKAEAWSIEYNSREDKMDKYLANFRAYEGTLSRAEMEQRLRGRVDGYRAQLPDPTTYNGLERSFQQHKTLRALDINALAYAEQIDPLTFEFDGSLSSSWKRIDSYHWAFGDGTTAAGRLATHTYDQPGTYEVVLTTSSRYYGSDSHTLTVKAASPTVTTPLQVSGLRPIWEENFPGGSPEKGVFTWARGHNDALTSSTIPGALHIGHQRGQQWGRHWTEHQINFFKTADNEPPPTILEFDLFTPLTGDNRLSLRKTRFGGEFVHIRLSNRKDVSLVVLKSQKGSNVPRQYIYYDEKTGPGYGWAHITLSYDQSIRNGQRYVHYVLAINEEVREFEGLSDWPGDSWLDYWARIDNAEAWSIEYNSTEDKMDNYLANFRAYEGTLSRAEMEQRLQGRVDGYRAQLPDPTTYNGLERSFQQHKTLRALDINALAYAEQIDPLTVEFDGSLSSSWKRIDSYHWAFGDGTTAAGRLATHTYDQPGTYQVVLTTSNRYYGADSHTFTIDITDHNQGTGLLTLTTQNSDETGTGMGALAAASPLFTDEYPDEFTDEFTDSGDFLAIDDTAGQTTTDQDVGRKDAFDNILYFPLVGTQ